MVWWRMSKDMMCVPSTGGMISCCVSLRILSNKNWDGVCLVLVAL